MEILLKSYASKMKEIVDADTKACKKIALIKRLNKQTLLFLNMYEKDKKD